MHFCSKCQNMYYLKIRETEADDETEKLVYYCRNCGHEDNELTGETICVSKTVIRESEEKFASIINEYTKEDPTLPRTKMIKCPNTECKSNVDKEVDREVLYIRYDETNMKYIYMCSHCDTTWKTNQHNV